MVHSLTHSLTHTLAHTLAHTHTHTHTHTYKQRTMESAMTLKVEPQPHSVEFRLFSSLPTVTTADSIGAIERETIDCSEVMTIPAASIASTCSGHNAASCFQ